MPNKLIANRFYSRREAAKALGDFGDSAAIPALIAALKDDKYVAEEAANALVKIGQPATFALVTALRDKRTFGMAAETLVKIGQPAVPALIATLNRLSFKFSGIYDFLH